MTRQHANGEVEFSFFGPGAQGVFLLGDFNHWDQSASPMRCSDGGWWRCRLRLRPGSYQFKYFADGQWYVDYASFGVEQGPWGHSNSVVLVVPRQVREKPIQAEDAEAEVDSLRVVQAADRSVPGAARKSAAAVAA